MTPYTRHEFNSNSAGEGYIVWHRNPTTGEARELRILHKDADRQLQLIIDFLNAS